MRTIAVATLAFLPGAFTSVSHSWDFNELPTFADLLEYGILPRHPLGMAQDMDILHHHRLSHALSLGAWLIYEQTVTSNAGTQNQNLAKAPQQKATMMNFLQVDRMIREWTSDLYLRRQDQIQHRWYSKKGWTNGYLESFWGKRSLQWKIRLTMRCDDANEHTKQCPVACETRGHARD